MEQLLDQVVAVLIGGPLIRINRIVVDLGQHLLGELGAFRNHDFFEDVGHTWAVFPLTSTKELVNKLFLQFGDLLVVFLVEFLDLDSRRS